MKKFAEISSCGKYRYTLKRIWDDTLPAVMFICLNPSTADAIIDDPTLRRCISFAKRWGYGGVLLGNLFALRATRSDEIKRCNNPVGPKNDTWLIKMKADSKKVIAAWGDKGVYSQRNKEIYRMFPDIYYLKLSRQGNPCHPLYLSRLLIPKKLNTNMLKEK